MSPPFSRSDQSGGAMPAVDAVVARAPTHRHHSITSRPEPDHPARVIHRSHPIRKGTGDHRIRRCRFTASVPHHPAWMSRARKTHATVGVVRGPPVPSTSLEMTSMADRYEIRVLGRLGPALKAAFTTMHCTVVSHQTVLRCCLSSRELHHLLERMDRSDVMIVGLYRVPSAPVTGFRPHMGRPRDSSPRALA
jgi:hypothetical protein